MTRDRLMVEYDKRYCRGMILQVIKDMERKHILQG